MSLVTHNITILAISTLFLIGSISLNHFYDHKLITLHTVSNKKINYHENHHLAMMSLTFRNSDKEYVKNYAAKHLEEMKKFNEQLSTVTEELT